MQSTLRLRIAEHFDSLRNQVDLFTETKISKNVEQESFWNKRRQDQMDEIEQMETAGLAKASRVRDESIAGEESEMMMSELLDGVCFLLEYGCMQFLVKVDRHVDQAEIEYLRKFVKLEKGHHRKMIEFLTNGLKYNENITFGALVNKMKEILTVDSAVVNMSWWFGQECHIDWLELELSLRRAPKKFDCPLRINKVYVWIDLSNVSVKDIVETLQIIQDGFKHAKSIVITLGERHQSDLKKISTLPSIKSEQRTTHVICADLLESDIKLDDQVYHKVVDVSPHLANRFSSVNWGQIYELTFSDCNADDLDQVDLSSVRSLRKCIFSNCYLDQVNWSFLDPIRACIQHLEFMPCCQSSSVSWKMFSGMIQLESLKFDHSSYTEVDLDAQGQLFADLIQLKSLALSINKRMLNKEWLCEHPRLEELEMRIEDNSAISVSRDMQANMRFKLPMLSKLEFISCSERLNLDLAPALSGLSHVQKLVTQSNILRKGWFRGFKCSSLVCDLDYSIVDSSLFLGLDNLKSISLDDIDAHLFKDNAFAALVNLENILLDISDKTWLKRNMQKFNGLQALKSICICCNRNFSESLVFFQNLNKFISVQKSDFFFVQ